MDVPDATCTRTRLWFSVVLLAIGAGYTLTGIGYIDTTGACHAGLTSREAKPDKKVTSLS